ncbi:MAG TPA: hypothetical protein PLL20_06595 [Phycisphaerae bacterium]|nr:hypothetical protein [Phycisphaerae bacterium]HRR85553.1 hypothetical protein [Phycisphaerae bacterium]
MPVQFRRDELPADDNDVRQRVVWEANGSTKVGDVARAVYAGLWVSVPGAVGLCLGLNLIKRALLAAEVLSKDNDYWRETWIPMLLFCFYGGLLGAGIAWRVTSAVSLGGPAIWLAAGASLILVLLAGIGASTWFVFPGNVPSTCWIGLGLLVGAAVVGVHAVNAWND